MQFVNDFILNTKKTFAHLKNPQVQKILLILIALQFIVELLTSKMQTGQNPLASLSVFLVIFPLLFVLTLAQYYFQYKSIHVLMPDGKKPYDFIMFLKVFLMGFLQSLAALFSVFDLKWLVIPVLSIILIAVGVVFNSNAVASLMLYATGALLLFIYFLIVIRNFMRLAFMIPAYMQNASLAFLETFKTTWTATSGKALKIFARFLLFSIIIALPLFLVYFALNAGGTMIDTLLNLPVDLFAAVLSTPLYGIVILTSMFYFFETFNTMLPKIGKQTTASKTEKVETSEAKLTAKTKITSKQKK